MLLLVAVRERDAAVADAERRAGRALREMTENEGLSVREAVEWCGDEITTRDATRLRGLAQVRAAGDPKTEVGAAEGLARRFSPGYPMINGGSSDCVAASSSMRHR